MFDVFVEGPVDLSPGAVRKLAETIAAKYGIQADDFAARLARGRVRVKAKVDRQTADAYARSLAKVGARCSVEETRGGEASAPITKAATPPVGVPVTGRPTTPPLGMPRRAQTPAIGVSVRTATPPGVPMRSTTPPGVPVMRSPVAAKATQTPGRGVVAAPTPSARPSTLSDAPVNTLRPPAPYVAARFKAPSTPAESRHTSQPIASGLAAASGAPADTQLGALDSEADGMTLSSLDGHVAPASSASFGPAVELDDGPYAVPAASVPPPSGGARPKDEPLDLFAPADDGAEFKVDVAPDDDYARKKSMPLPRESEPQLSVRAPEPPAKLVAPRSKLGPLKDVKIRFAAGVVAAILLGFLPATVVASIRERSAFRAIDEQYLKEQADATAQDASEIEAKFLDRKRSERRGIALTSMVIWAVAGGAIAYVWFRRVPWDRWA